MIKVCDSIMGSGKSSAAINYINSNLDKKFIYITPFLTEVDRICNACPDAKFIQPSNRVAKYGRKKKTHTAALIKEGSNIVTTHQAFKNYDSEMLNDIRSIGYTLIIDEDVEALTEIPIHMKDVEMLMSSGYVEERDGEYKATEKAKEYTDGGLYETLDAFRDCRVAIRPEGSSAFFWMLSKEMLASFDDVIIMTYMYDAQSIRVMIDAYALDYEFIYVKNEDGKYSFSREKQPLPEYTKNLKNLVHICDHKKINAFGEKDFSLSLNWFKKRNRASLKGLKNAIYTYVRHVVDTKSGDVIWSTYCDAKDHLRGKGYSNSFINFNSRATNDYGDRTTCVYAVNVFMNVDKKIFMKQHGVEFDDDRYALSTMVQWLWRSAVRNGKEINVYIPSKRMRNLLIEWMDRLENGGES